MSDTSPLPLLSIHPYHLTVQPPCNYPTARSQPVAQPQTRPISNSKRRSAKTAHQPAKTMIIATKTTLATPIQPHPHPTAPLKRAEMSGNERDFPKSPPSHPNP